MNFFLIIIFSGIFSMTAPAQLIFKTPSGNKYHLSSCRMVKNVSQEISKSEARQMGLTPCAICVPENIYAASAPSIHKAKGEGVSTQCLGYTKAKKRCRHMTRISNGYCYQHQP